ncbi:MAG: DUF664 domain-containing protein [Geodermatophilaceae bacterium]
MSDRAEEAVREILRDSFGRVRGLVEGVCEGLSHEQATYRPDPDANTIAWLVWHLTRITDDHVAGLVDSEQVWAREGWAATAARCRLMRRLTVMGRALVDVAEVQTDPALLVAYHADVHHATLAYVDGVDAAELARAVDTAWDPPVTVSIRLVSVIGDCLQHLGQAAYVRGLAERALGR